MYIVYKQYGEEMISTCTCITHVRCRTDSKFESLLYIIEVKCVSEFDIIDALGEENSVGKVCT